MSEEKFFCFHRKQLDLGFLQLQYLKSVTILFLHPFCRSLYLPDEPSNYLTVSREYIQNLEYRLEGTRLDLYKNKEVKVRFFFQLKVESQWERTVQLPCIKRLKENSLLTVCHLRVLRLMTSVCLPYTWMIS